MEWLKYLLPGVPGILLVIFVYGKLSQQVQSMHAQLADTVARLNQHHEDASIHTTEDIKGRDREFRAEIRGKLESIDLKLDFLMKGVK